MAESAAFAARRAFLRTGGALLTLLVTPLAWAAAAPTLLGVRIWPAPDYTRLTFEHDVPLNFKHLTLKNPERVVLDLEGIELNAVVQGLPAKVLDNDPHIKQIRVGRFKPDVVRIVIDLKGEATPQLFSLKPVGAYGHRLVLDLYPPEPPDPLLALLEKHGKGASVGGGGKAGEPLVDRLVTVAIDPGHGGEDPGAIGYGGSYEKNVTLSIARRLKSKIDAQPNMRALLTRDGDYFVPLGQRVAKARRAKADLFVSIHADAFIKPTARGSSVFVLSENGASSTAARWLADKENAADLVGGVNLAVRDAHLARTLLDLSQTATLNDSFKLAKAVLGEVGGINALHKSHVEQAGFAVLKAPDIPSILVETAFISNPEEEKRLNDEAYQERMAEAMLAGMQRYFAQSPTLTRTRVARLD